MILKHDCAELYHMSHPRNNTWYNIFIKLIWTGNSKGLLQNCYSGLDSTSFSWTWDPIIGSWKGQELMFTSRNFEDSLAHLASGLNDPANERVDPLQRRHVHPDLVELGSATAAASSSSTTAASISVPHFRLRNSGPKNSESDNSD